MIITMQMGFVDIATQWFEAMGCFHHYCPCQEARLALTEADIQRGPKTREVNEMRKKCIEEKGYTVVELWEGEWLKLYKTVVLVKERLRKSFPYKPSIGQYHLLDRKIGRLVWLRLV